MVKEIVLSICIPTYNRIAQLQKTISQILVCKSPKYEVVVLDNCSLDDTYNVLKNIKDCHLQVYKNEKNIGAYANSRKVFELAKGKYVMILLDKDRLVGERLDVLLDVLEKEDYGLGYCMLNCIEEKENLSFSPGIDSLMNMSYLSKHPSGSFYRNTLLQKNLCKTKSDTYNPFYLEFVNAEICMEEFKTIIVKSLLVCTETEEELIKTQTHTYNMDNLFFLPKSRYVEYKAYLSHMASLALKDYEYAQIFMQLWIRYLGSLLSARKMKNKKEILWHYNVNKADVEKETSIYNLMKCIYKMCKFCLREKRNRNIKIIFYMMLEFIYIWGRRKN